MIFTPKWAAFAVALGLSATGCTSSRNAPANSGGSSGNNSGGSNILPGPEVPQSPASGGGRTLPQGGILSSIPGGVVGGPVIAGVPVSTQPQSSPTPQPTQTQGSGRTPGSTVLPPGSVPTVIVTSTPTPTPTPTTTNQVSNPVPTGATTVPGRGPSVPIALSVTGRLDAETGFNATFQSGLTTNGFGGLDSANAIAFQTQGSNNGRIIAVGKSGSNAYVARYLSSGALDLSFGSAGLVLFPSSGSGTSSELFDVKVMSDDRIVAVGKLGQSFFVARLMASGQPDRTFRCTTNLLSGSATCSAGAMPGTYTNTISAPIRDAQASFSNCTGTGVVVIGGLVHAAGYCESPSRSLVVIRLQDRVSAGDPTASVSTVAYTNAGAGAAASSLATDGTALYVAGLEGSLVANPIVLRVAQSSAGLSIFWKRNLMNLYSLENLTFDFLPAGHPLRQPEHFARVAVAADGNVLVTGHLSRTFSSFSSGPELYVVKLLNSGQDNRDLSFGGQGNGMYRFGSMSHGLALGVDSASGSIYVGGVSVRLWSNGFAEDQMLAFRLNSNGTRDTSFGTSGQYVFNGSTGTPTSDRRINSVRSVLLMPAVGKVLLGGAAGRSGTSAGSIRIQMLD